MTSRYSSLTRDELATLVPELLLIGQLIDRSGMAWCISAFGREEMAQIAIEEWAGSSPFYTRRMQRALGYEGTDVVTIFKGLQLDIGAPPQFMDFRYAVSDPWHGEFWLDHCGALMDVEPMGEDYVRSMCHDIEDPTFDATSGPDGAFFLGDPDSIVAKLERVADQLGGVQRISLQMTNPRLAHDDLLRGIELLGTEVAPRVAHV